MLMAFLFHTIKSLRCTLIFLLFLVPIFIHAENFSDKDSLRAYSYDLLYKKIRDSRSNHPLQTIYLEKFLEKAKSEKNKTELVEAYRFYIHYGSEKLRYNYADSMIWAAENSKDNSLIADANLAKAIAFYQEKKYKEALSNLVTASEIAEKTNNQYLLYKIRYQVGMVKYYLEYYDEAIDLFKNCIAFFKYENARGYLNSLHALSLCHHRLGDIGLSSDLNNLGITEGVRLGNKNMESYFRHLEGINHFFRNNYNLAIKEINASLDGIQLNNDFASEAIAFFYLGKSYRELDKKDIALGYFTRVDEIFQEKQYLRHDLRETYEILINHYQSVNNTDLERYYVKQLLKADSILIENQKYLPFKIHKDFDNKELLTQKVNAQKKEADASGWKIFFIWIAGILLLIITILILRNIQKSRIYAKKFEEIMQGKQKEISMKTIKRPILNISPEVVESIVKQLEKFEKGNKFLDQDITLAKLSMMFNFNSKYISIIIHEYRGKAFSEYINDLKIDYLIESMKIDRKVRSYNNEALSELAGFTSIERFTRAFKSRTNMPTTVFVEKLNSLDRQ